MKTIYPPEGYIFEECIMMLGKCLFVIYKQENEKHITRLYNPISESCVTPICEYPSEKDIELKCQGKIFRHIPYRSNYYDPFHPLITENGSLLFGLPFYSRNEIEHEKQICFDPFTAEKLVIETGSSNALDRLVSMKTRYFYDSKTNTIAFITKLHEYGRNYYDYGFSSLGIEVIAILSKHDFQKLPDTQLFLLQLNHSSEPKIFELGFKPSNVKIHPSEPLVLVYNHKMCTLIDLEI